MRLDRQTHIFYKNWLGFFSFCTLNADIISACKCVHVQRSTPFLSCGWCPVASCPDRRSSSVLYNMLNQLRTWLNTSLFLQMLEFTRHLNQLPVIYMKWNNKAMNGMCRKMMRKTEWKGKMKKGEMVNGIGYFLCELYLFKCARGSMNKLQNIPLLDTCSSLATELHIVYNKECITCYNVGH